MFQIKGPILAAMDLDKGSEELLRQADALARSYKVKLSVCHVLSRNLCSAALVSSTAS